MSDLGAALLLGMMEAAWRAVAPLRLHAQWPQLRDATECRSKAAQTRYVDDTASVSAHFCAECLGRLVSDQHTGIPFSVESTGGKKPMHWLDLQVHCDRVPVHVSMCMPELDYIMGRAEHPTKFRVGPYLGQMHHDPRMLRSHIRSLLSRWEKVRLSHGEVLRAVCYDMLILARADYPTEMILREWRRHSSDHRLSALLRAFFSKWQETPGPGDEGPYHSR